MREHSKINHSEKTIISTRILNVSRERAFNAWTDPNQLSQWWGPNGFTNTFNEFNLRPGGHWKYTMHGPDGTDYKNESVFVEILSPTRLILDHITGHRFTTIVDFENAFGKSRVIWKMRFESLEEFERVKSFILDANEENLDRLDAFIVKGE